MAGAKPTIVFLTPAWQDIDSNIREGKQPGGVQSVSQIWTSCLKDGFDVHVFILTPISSRWPKETTELGGVHFHWVRVPFQRITKWLSKNHLMYLGKLLWVIWQFKMLFRIWTSRVKPDVVYAMRPTFSVLGWLWARLVKAKSIVRIYGVWSYHAWFEQKGWTLRIKTLGEMLTMRIPGDLCIITNDGTGGAKSAEWLGVPSSRLRFWINGVDHSLRIHNFDTKAFKHRLGLGPDTPMLLTLGRLTRWKRLDRVLDAMKSILKEVPEARLVIVGGGELRDTLQQQVNRLGLADHVTFVGAVPHDEIVNYLNACDLFLMTNDLTNMCSTMIEALTTGCCVVTRDIGSTTDIVTDGQNAVVLNPGEARDVARAVVTLLKDPSERDRLGQAAHERAMRDFQTWDERMTMEVEEIKQLISAGKEQKTSS